MIMNRRTLLSLGVTGAVGGLAWRLAIGQNTTSTKDQLDMTESTLEILEGLDANPSSIEPLKLSSEQWQSVLDQDAYYVLRKEGTERPFTSPLNDEKRQGEFACAGCGLILFSSESKFDSGTGWPSFFDAIEGRIETKTDFKLIVPRTEYHCARCGGHQGHVFKDGPAPTGLRYCNNGVALSFLPT